MGQLKILVVDDEPLACRNLARKLAEIRPDLDVRMEVHPMKALDMLLTWQPDLLFLDVEMPEISGFDLLQQIPDARRTFPVVFCTAYSQYAVRAFEEAALDYLVKPVEVERLAKTLAKLDRGNPHHGLPAIHKAADACLKVIRARLREQIHFIAVDEICYFASEANETVIVLSNQKEFIVDLTLSELEERLDPRQFHRCHRSFIANLARVKSYHLKESLLFFSDDIRTVPVSRRCRAETSRLLKDRE